MCLCYLFVCLVLVLTFHYINEADNLWVPMIETRPLINEARAEEWHIENASYNRAGNNWNITLRKTSGKDRNVTVQKNTLKNIHSSLIVENYNWYKEGYCFFLAPIDPLKIPQNDGSYFDNSDDFSNGESAGDIDLENANQLNDMIYYYDKQHVDYFAGKYISQNDGKNKETAEENVAETLIELSKNYEQNKDQITGIIENCCNRFDTTGYKPHARFNGNGFAMKACRFKR